MDGPITVNEHWLKARSAFWVERIRMFREKLIEERITHYQTGLSRPILQNLGF